MLKYFLICILMMATVSRDLVVQAQDFELPVPALLEGEPDPGRVIAPIRKGQRTPFTGVVLSPQAVAALVVRLNSWDEEMQLEINRVKAEMMAEMSLRLSQQKSSHDADISVVQANLNSMRGQKGLLEDRLQNEIKNRPSRTVWFSLGVLGGVGLTIGVLFAVANSGI